MTKPNLCWPARLHCLRNKLTESATTMYKTLQKTKCLRLQDIKLDAQDENNVIAESYII